MEQRIVISKWNKRPGGRNMIQVVYKDNKKKTSRTVHEVSTKD